MRNNDNGCQNRTYTLKHRLLLKLFKSFCASATQWEKLEIPKKPLNIFICCYFIYFIAWQLWIDAAHPYDWERKKSCFKWMLESSIVKPFCRAFSGHSASFDEYLLIGAMWAKKWWISTHQASPFFSAKNCIRLNFRYETVQLKFERYGLWLHKILMEK